MSSKLPSAKQRQTLVRSEDRAWALPAAGDLAKQIKTMKDNPLWITPVGKEIIAGTILSNLLTSYYLGFDHPGKQKLWNQLSTWLKHPRLIRRFAAVGWISLDTKDLIQREILR